MFCNTNKYQQHLLIGDHCSVYFSFQYVTPLQQVKVVPQQLYQKFLQQEGPLTCC